MAELERLFSLLMQQASIPILNATKGPTVGASRSVPGGVPLPAPQPPIAVSIPGDVGGRPGDRRDPRGSPQGQRGAGAKAELSHVE